MKNSKDSGKSTDNIKSTIYNKKQPNEEEPSFIQAFVIFHINIISGILSFFIAIFRLFQMDNYFGIAFMLIIFYIVLKTLLSLCRNKKKVKSSNNKNLEETEVKENKLEREEVDDSKEKLE